MKSRIFQIGFYENIYSKSRNLGNGGNETFYSTFGVSRNSEQLCFGADVMIPESGFEFRENGF